MVNSKSHREYKCHFVRQISGSPEISQAVSKPIAHPYGFRAAPFASSSSTRGCTRRACTPPLLKAFTAEHGPSLRGFKRNRRFFTALRANSFGLDPLHASRARARTRALSAVPFARLAPFGFVLKTLVRKKHLLAGCENKFRRAIRALQDLVAVFHTPLRNRAGKERQRGSSALLLARNCPDGPQLTWPNPVHAFASFGDAYARGLPLRDAFHRASCSSCAS